MEARSPEKLTNVSKVKVSDEEVFLFRFMTIKANTKIVKERFGIYRVGSEMVFLSVIQALALRCKSNGSSQCERTNTARLKALSALIARPPSLRV